MSRAAASLGAQRHRIAELVFALDVGPRCRSLQGPEDLTAAIRRELLPAIESALRTVEATGQDLMLDRIELDLGETPEEPDWPALRRHLHDSLVSSLMARIDMMAPANAAARPRAEPVATPTGQRRVEEARTMLGVNGVPRAASVEDEAVDRAQGASSAPETASSRLDPEEAIPAEDATTGPPDRSQTAFKTKGGFEPTTKRRNTDPPEAPHPTDAWKFARRAASDTPTQQTTGRDLQDPLAQDQTEAAPDGRDDRAGTSVDQAGPRGHIDTGPRAGPAVGNGGDAPLSTSEGHGPSAAASPATADRTAIEAALAGWDRSELLRLGDALLAAHGGEAGARPDLAAITSSAVEDDGLPALVAELLETAGQGPVRPRADPAATAAPAGSARPEFGRSGPAAAAERFGGDAAGDAVERLAESAAAERSGSDEVVGPVDRLAKDAGGRGVGPGASRGPGEAAVPPAPSPLPPATPSAAADPALVTGLSGRLAEATPFASLGLQEALGLFWSALPAAIRADARAGGIFLGATARIAGGGAGRVDLAVLRRAIHDLLATAGTEADRRLAARTALTRMRYAAPGSPLARSLALAALAAVMPGLDDTTPDTTAGLLAGAGRSGPGSGPDDPGELRTDMDRADGTGTAAGGLEGDDDAGGISQPDAQGGPGRQRRALPVAPVPPTGREAPEPHDRGVAVDLGPVQPEAADDTADQAGRGMRDARLPAGGADRSGDAGEIPEAGGQDDPEAGARATAIVSADLGAGTPHRFAEAAGQGRGSAGAVDQAAGAAGEAPERLGLSGAASPATGDRVAIEAALAGWDRSELLRLGDALLAARGGEAGARPDLAAITSSAAENDDLPALVAELLETAGQGPVRPRTDPAATSAPAGSAGPEFGRSGQDAAAERSGGDAAGVPVERLAESAAAERPGGDAAGGPVDRLAEDAGGRGAGLGSSRGPGETAVPPAPSPLPPATPSAAADPALVTGLSGRLAEATPFASLGLQEALGLFWSALPAAIRADARAGGIFLGATARIAGGGAGRVDLAVLRRAIHDLLATAGTEADRRLAARTALTRMRYAAPGSPRARSLALAALAAVMPGLDDATPDTTAGLVTGVAGLVLFAPYLRMLFDRGGVLDAAGRIPADRLSRAYALLGALSDRDVAQPDPLERVLLGVPPGQPIDRAPLDDELRTLTDGLVRAVIAQWGALGKTSPDGLREAFVRRDGDLILEPEGAARLRVLPGPFDMLLDRLSWSIALIRTPWMPGPLHVRWRGHDDS